MSHPWHCKYHESFIEQDSSPRCFGKMMDFFFLPFFFLLLNCYPLGALSNCLKRATTEWRELVSKAGKSEPSSFIERSEDASDQHPELWKWWKISDSWLVPFFLQCQSSMVATSPKDFIVTHQSIVNTSKKMCLPLLEANVS